MFETVLVEIQNTLLPQILDLLYLLLPIWLPIILGMVLWHVWINYIRASSIHNTTYKLLEIRVPKDVNKSPLAMEIVLNALHQVGGEATWYDRNVKGTVRAWFSLEIVSIGGRVHFFIWTRAGFKNIIEAQLYSQYPGIEVHEVSDYTTAIKYDPEVYSLWACDFVLAKPDPYPIKTYVDYGMLDDPKEEFKIDPITPMIEFFGSLRKGEQAWLQIMVRAHKKEAGQEKDPWIEEAKKEINDILKRDEETKGPASKSEEGSPIMPRLSKGDQEIVSALERSIGKLGFDAGIKFIYLAEKDNFVGANIPGFIGSFRQYNSNHLNGFKLSNVPGFNYPWQDVRGIMTNKQKVWAIDSYKRRSYFHPPYKRKHFILNSEELATIFHFPGGVSSTPTFSRIMSKKGEAPADLPI